MLTILFQPNRFQNIFLGKTTYQVSRGKLANSEVPLGTGKSSRSKVPNDADDQGEAVPGWDSLQTHGRTPG